MKLGPKKALQKRRDMSGKWPWLAQKNLRPSETHGTHNFTNQILATGRNVQGVSAVKVSESWPSGLN